MASVTIIGTFSIHTVNAFVVITGVTSRQTGLRIFSDDTVDDTNDKEEEETNTHTNDTRMSRRRALVQSSRMAASIAAMTMVVNPPLVLAATTTDTSTTTTTQTMDHTDTDAHLNSIDGLQPNDEHNKSSSSSHKPVPSSFDPSSSAPKPTNDEYESSSRTTPRATIEQAIQQRLTASPDNLPPAQQAVLQIGAGPTCRLALTAAQAGAGTVYAVLQPKHHHDDDAAKSARDTVQKMGYQNVVTVIEGYSTEITLPARVDFVVIAKDDDDLLGSYTTATGSTLEEEVYAAVADAHERHVKKPEEASSWIPEGIQTLAPPLGSLLCL